MTIPPEDRSVIAPAPLSGEEPEDAGLRPGTFDDFVGQDPVRNNLRVAITAARQRKEAVDHILFSGMPGLGKTTLAHIVAREMGTQMVTTSGPVIDRPGDLAGILSSLGEGDVLFIDEIHRLNRNVEEYLYSAMEDFRIDILLDQGPNARSVNLELKPFTLVGATTREGLVAGPLRSRFGVLEKLELYPWEDLAKIIRRSAGILKIGLEDAATEVISRRSRGVPRIANRFLRRVRDLAQVKREKRVSADIAREALGMLGVDENGLVATDRKILEILARRAGEPVGLKAIALTVGEEEDTIEEVYEPYLMIQGYLDRTPRGRAATPRTMALFPGSGKGLF
ncbi:MAG: Holliday junction branch migration DNA helicase RuvB [Planctomycetota bacterium]